MHFSTLVVAVLAPLAVIASPVPKVDESADVMAIRAMESWAWQEPVMERSPSDPELIKRIVYNPKITSPTAETVWNAGQTYKVTWSTDDIPADAKEYKGMVKLGYEPADGEGGLNLKKTLAKDFQLTDNEVEVTIPENQEERSDYIIVLMGDSGNASPHFTIKPKSDAPSFLNIEELLDQASEA
ncbi:hypothetical protein IE81DRAFT_94370 [Ceraceosorus guamensis]|uniref:Ser-Thr-rich glycosyl-phosphatidyl-inositol-anchored membrane family-domain-containing protein n=1 Tax=Ceraceosorus guamensis TaxID=1522189 RepID=A0A316W0M6_9BASI|nr:hypothetical protein IE81DRAFT_94370 [Ceraceosorus guamensis]PWN43292.1 hypothetical protein IE81DRAFT_94370 [Ceraceosorus guamensis]